MRRENENVVFADGVVRLYRHAECLFPLALERGTGFGHRVHGPAFGVQEPAGIGIEVLDEPWCRIIGQMPQHRCLKSFAIVMTVVSSALAMATSDALLKSLLSAFAT